MTMGVLFIPRAAPPAVVVPAGREGADPLLFSALMIHQPTRGWLDWKTLITSRYFPQKPEELTPTCRM
ncbi:hypothetical protein [Corynebacterium efficiens YS-314]|uniref:Uncharacterized protein n=1 Tax=Corynebacterium efficiens (strain DSM 44549 / YS-314 / AJ 12310 / JCM 11189 / NBRC 100395) TaxID=196164 RepID=Q8FPQ6_COREF|nr:hypothetical protein [Corynebacterium efficiens YS-314]